MFSISKFRTSDSLDPEKTEVLKIFTFLTHSSGCSNRDWLEPAGSHASHDSPTVPPVVSLFLKKRFKVDQKYCDKDVLLWILLY